MIAVDVKAGYEGCRRESNGYLVALLSLPFSSGYDPCCLLCRMRVISSPSAVVVGVLFHKSVSTSHPHPFRPRVPFPPAATRTQNEILPARIPPWRERFHRTGTGPAPGRKALMMTIRCNPVSTHFSSHGFTLRSSHRSMPSSHFPYPANSTPEPRGHYLAETPSVTRDMVVHRRIRQEAVDLSTSLGSSCPRPRQLRLGCHVP